MCFFLLFKMVWEEQVWLFKYLVEFSYEAGLLFIGSFFDDQINFITSDQSVQNVFLFLIQSWKNVKTNTPFTQQCSFWGSSFLK